MLVGYCVETLYHALMCPLVHTSTMGSSSTSSSSSCCWHQAYSSQVVRSTCCKGPSSAPPYGLASAAALGA
jgi:hypothetical protein